MGREKAAKDIAVRFWKGDERDELVAQILESVPSGDKNSYIKNLIIEHHKKETQCGNELSNDSISQIVNQALEKQEKMFQTQLKDMEMQLLLQMSNMLGRIEGSMQSGAIAFAQPNQTANAFSADAYINEEKEPEITEDVLDFIDSLGM